MYATAHRVSDGQGHRGINAFLHKHGTVLPWPEEAWRLPETDPGVLIWSNGPEVRPGGNHVHSYLDVLAPDAATHEEVERALEGLSLELAAHELGPRDAHISLPNPVVYRHARVVLRFGVEGELLEHRARELGELRRYVDPATAVWFGNERAAG